MSTGDTDAIPLDVPRVAIDTVFTVETARGDRADYLIANDGIGPPGVILLASRDDLARATLGMGVGDKLPLHLARPAPEEWRISSIKHKWLWALHDTMERFERRFPLHGGLHRVILQTEGPEPLEPVLEWVRARSETVNSALEEYTSKSLSLDFVARRVGSDVIDGYIGLQEHKRPFRVCLGNQPEREAAFTAIRDNQQRGCVLDALTLFLIRRLDIGDAVSAACGPLRMVETSIDILRDRLEQARFNARRQALSLSYSEGRFYRREITLQDSSAVVADREMDLLFATERCQELPAVGKFDPPLPVRQLAEVVRGDFLDPALAAQGADLVYVCEDFGRRLIVGPELELRTSWLQPILMVSKKSGWLTEKAYTEAAVSLVEANHEYTSIDPNVLLVTSQMNGGQLIAREFASLARALGGQTADMASHLAVAVDFFRGIWRGEESHLRKMALTGRVLDCLLREHWSEWQLIVAELHRRCGHLAFKNYLHDWLRGHLLIPF